MQLRFRALGMIATLYQSLGVLIAIGAVVLAVLISLDALGNQRPIYVGNRYVEPFLLPQLLIAVVTVVVGGIAGVASFAVGEFFHLLRDLELNTRETAAAAQETAHYSRQSAALLQQLVQRRVQSAPPTPARPTGNTNPR